MKLLLALLTSTVLLAANGPQEILLWSHGAPGSEGKNVPEQVVETDGIRRISSVHKPSITLHLPSKETATGAAVIILPGGGHRHLSIDHEGHLAAKWLAERGVAGVVVKYRLAREANSTYRMEVEALMDVQRAIRMVRSRAAEWGIDPARIGIMGFSAGGELAAYAAIRFDAGRADAPDSVDRASSRPAFQALIYSGSLKAEAAFGKDAPPAFIMCAYDDRGHIQAAVDLFEKLRAVGVNAELHVYSQGGHGFGMRDRPLPVTSWPVRFHEWLGDRGFLKTSTN